DSAPSPLSPFSLHDALPILEQYVALDVSLKEISVCIVDSNGEVVFEGKTAAEPAILVELIRSKAPQVKRVGLETGATSPWLFHADRKSTRLNSSHQIISYAV